MATAMNISAWSTTANSNDGADSTIGTVANTSAPNVVDDWVRGIMASVKRYVLDKDGGITAGGTGNALTITTNRVISSGHQAAGFSVRFKASATNTGAATVAVDGLSAVSIKRPDGSALSAGDIVSGGIYELTFDGTNYQLLGAIPPASNSFSAAVTISASAPSLTLTDTDTGSDCRVSGSSSTGTLVLSADLNNEVASSQIVFNIDGSDVGTFSAAGALNLTTIELGHASDTTLARSAAGTVTVEGNTLCRIKTGTYTGDGSTSKAVTGVGFTPKYVRIWTRVTSSTALVLSWTTTDTIIDDNASGMAVMDAGPFGATDPASQTDAIIALGSDGFTVDDAGVDADPNATGTVYNYLCLG